jgi:hypothetical protein
MEIQDAIPHLLQRKFPERLRASVNPQSVILIHRRSLAFGRFVPTYTKIRQT